MKMKMINENDNDNENDNEEKELDYEEWVTEDEDEDEDEKTQNEDLLNDLFSDMRLSKIQFNENNYEVKSNGSLSASERSKNSLFIYKENQVNFVKLFNIPVQINCIEMLDKTLDNHLEENDGISDEEWTSILFQVCFGLAVAQKHYNFVHNDLHSSNIMLKKTELEFLFSISRQLF